MPVSRRRFISTSTALAAAATVLPSLEPFEPEQAQAQMTTPSGLPEPAIIALNRMAFGPRPGDIERVRGLGLSGYIDEQLAPSDASDAEFNARLAATKLRIEYGPWSARIREDLPFTHLNKPLEELWLLTQGNMMDDAQRNRPLDEVIAATWLRAVYSRYQLRELLVDFWHNHFNVYCYTNREVSSTWPLYDRIMRANCLGNFRTFLGEVAQSVAMQYYLNNASNTKAGPNENYARELFELHTLGSNNYFNNLYDDWSKVPGADTGKPIGYVDDDVYEAARALTGWTIEDGSRHGGVQLPNTGKFRYNEAAHDRFQKRVLASAFNNDQTAEADGNRVLDLVANHPGTAKYICLKLCRRLVADNPPGALVDRAAALWTQTATAPDQIKQVVELILRSDEFKGSWGQKVKRPFELYVSFIRATGVEFPPAAIFRTGLAYDFSERAGQRLFNWRTPTGYPDLANYWLSTSVTLRRWNGLATMLNDRNFWGLSNQDGLPMPLRQQTPSDKRSSAQIVDYWIERMLGRTVGSAVRDALIDFLSQGRGPNATPQGDTNDLNERVNLLVGLIGMTPDFQYR